jgi:high affinity Mn2+ porin
MQFQAAPKPASHKSPQQARISRDGIGKLAVLMAVLIYLAPASYGQTANQDDAGNPPTADDPAVTIFPHSQTAPYWISGQNNVIFQWHPSLDAKYSGPNSLRTRPDHATSNVSTLFLGYQAGSNTELLLDVEEASGGGLSDGLGLAGITNLDVVRNPLLSKAPYIARGMIRQIIPLSQDTVEVDRNPLALATRLPVRRLELRAGKFGTADFFDVNGVGSDTHFQFMNWTSDNNGAYDYAADTRGYTLGVMVEYHERNWAFRFDEALMPKVANGIDLVWNLRRARAENFELELHPSVAGKRNTTVRLLSYVNHANMGVYRRAVEDFLAGKTSQPDITAHRLQTTVKYGFGLNLEQDFAHHLRGFVRWGWDEGQHESYAYTEVDETFEGGADLAGNAWRRALDKVGVVFVSNGISADHQHYLELGGVGFLLGDGALNYGRENIFETYYNAHIWRGIFLGFDLQHVNHPGYNRDRGPVLAPGFRMHLEL